MRLQDSEQLLTWCRTAADRAGRRTAAAHSTAPAAALATGRSVRPGTDLPAEAHSSHQACLAGQEVHRQGRCYTAGGTGLLVSFGRWASQTHTLPLGLVLVVRAVRHVAVGLSLLGSLYDTNTADAGLLIRSLHARPRGRPIWGAATKEAGSETTISAKRPLTLHFVRSVLALWDVRDILQCGRRIIDAYGSLLYFAYNVVSLASQHMPSCCLADED